GPSQSTVQPLHITCTTDQRHTFTTHTGCHTITSIDYNNQVIIISEPTISPCTCTQPSKGFDLDSTPPFSFHDDTALCQFTNNATSTFTMCDSQTESIRSLFYSCEPISRLSSSSPISTCC
ncbi:hypothetical protein MIMGU_mgv1a022445mg, partial [Erythranthe guttata]